MSFRTDTPLEELLRFWSVREMKLMFCPHCGDFVTLRRRKERACECGKCRGQYVGYTRAVVSGDGVQVVAISTPRLLEIVKRLLNSEPTSDGLDDYCRPENIVPAWVYGPNALKITKETTLDEDDEATKKQKTEAELELLKR